MKRDVILLKRKIKTAKQLQKELGKHIKGLERLLKLAKHGDGKIFVTSVEEAIRIGTVETGQAAV